MNETTRDDLGLRIYRRLLWVYPAEFRRRYGAEIEEAFCGMRCESAPSTFAETARFWIRIVIDLAQSAARVRRPRHHPSFEDGAADPSSNGVQMESVLQDVGFACRQLRRRPGFATAAALSLALGIGGTTLMYSLADGLVLHPFPYPDADRLVAVGRVLPRLSADVEYIEALSPAESEDIRRVGAFSSAVVFDLGNRNISGGDRAERVFTALIWGDPFAVVGMPPHLGRGFREEDWREGAARTVIISHRLWVNRFASNAGLIGQAIRVNGEPATLLGVMPPELLLLGTDMWLPLTASPARWPRNARQFNVLARLAPGVTLDAANARLQTLAYQTSADHKQTFPEYEGWRLVASPWADAVMGSARPMTLMLLGAITAVLALACANLTNLQLAHATGREREMSVRLALGAGRTRLARQLLTESAVLAALGAAGGVALAWAGVHAALPLLPEQVQSLDLQLDIGPRILVFAIGVTLVTVMLVGGVPAWFAARTSGSAMLRTGASGPSGGRTFRSIRHALIVLELALAVTLLAGAGLFARSFLSLQRVSPGFDPSRVLTMRLTLPRERYQDAAVTAFFDELVRRVEALPGVARAAAGTQFPPMSMFTREIRIEGRETPGEALPTSVSTVVSPQYFDALGVPVLRGRGFTRDDSARAPAVAIVNQRFADRYFPGENPLGRRVAFGGSRSTSNALEIIGVTADVRNRGPRSRVEPELFTPVEQDGGQWNQLFLVVRAERDPRAILPAVRGVIAAMDADQPVYAIQTLEDSLAATMFQQRTAMSLMALFAGLALVLAIVGVYGVLSYLASARTLEVGVRLAVGAHAGAVVRMLLRQAAVVVIAGIAAGLAGAVVVGRAVSGMLYGVEPGDPLTLVAVAIVMCVVAMAAAFAPARRASRLDPARVLREQ